VSRHELKEVVARRDHRKPHKGTRESPASSTGPPPTTLESGSPDEPATISVVVPSFGRPDDLVGCVKAILSQAVPPLEILVVLRDDDIESRRALSDAKAQVRIVEVDRPGQVAALNAGRAAARGAVLAFTDDDARPRTCWTQEIRHRFSTDAAIGAVGGQDIVHRDGRVLTGRTTHIGRILRSGRLRGLHHFESTLQDVSFLKGANMAYRATALQGFDESLWGSGAQVCNDLEASLSVRVRGWRVVWDPRVQVDHFMKPRVGNDQRDSRTLEAERAHAHNDLYVLLKHLPLSRAPFVITYRIMIGYRHLPGLLLTLAGGGLQHGPTLRIRRVLALTSARFDAIGTAWRYRRKRRRSGPVN